MRRSVIAALASTVAITAAAILATTPAPQPTTETTLPPQAVRIVEGVDWAVGGNRPTATITGCTPTTDAACQQIIAAACGFVVLGTAKPMVTFVIED
ncbi:MAG TPA: hypothetical protein VLA88_02265 [Candidatus Saccharimonadales bacterium]|nr:hypothetical protein [Candidatus Saccharimonadales bacterium]